MSTRQCMTWAWSVNPFTCHITWRCWCCGKVIDWLYLHGLSPQCIANILHASHFNHLLVYGGCISGGSAISTYSDIFTTFPSITCSPVDSISLWSQLSYTSSERLIIWDQEEGCHTNMCSPVCPQDEPVAFLCEICFINNYRCKFGILKNLNNIVWGILSQCYSLYYSFRWVIKHVTQIWSGCSHLNIKHVRCISWHIWSTFQHQTPVRTVVSDAQRVIGWLAQLWPTHHSHILWAHASNLKAASRWRMLFCNTF